MLDGAKLFSKASCFLEFRLGYSFFLCATVFSIGYLYIVLVFVHVGLLFSSSVAIGSIFFALGVVEIFEISLLQTSRNSFVSLAINRVVLIFVLNEIAFGFLFFYFIMLDLSAGFHAYAASYCLHKLLWLVILPLIFLVADKAPFDLVEAESELVDGVTTDVSGIVFSFLFSAETFSTLVLLLLVSMLSPSGSLLVFGMLAYLFSFVGRVFLPRILIADALDGTIQVAL